jgi:hypothetical protein
VKRRARRARSQNVALERLAEGQAADVVLAGLFDAGGGIGHCLPVTTVDMLMPRRDVQRCARDDEDLETAVPTGAHS